MAISFEPSEAQTLLLDATRAFLARDIARAMRDTESKRTIDEAVQRRAHELGLTTIVLPEHVGGPELGLVTACLVEEELARADAAACFALGGPGNFGSFVLELCTVETQRALLARFTSANGYEHRGAVAWSEPEPAQRDGLGTIAVRGGEAFIIDGQKAFVLNAGLAESLLVLAQTRGQLGYAGLGAFVVPADAKGVKVGPRRTLLGLDAAHVADVLLDGVRVPESALVAQGEDLRDALVRAFARVTLLNAARAVGIATRAYELTKAYCAERVAFGKPIGHFQAVAFTVADRLMDVESARWLVWRAAADWDRAGKPNLPFVASAGAHALEGALRTTDDGVQLHGGAGFIRDFPVEKLFRDARQLACMGPTIATLDQMLAESMLSGSSLDPRAVLPTSDIQPICT